MPSSIPRDGFPKSLAKLLSFLGNAGNLINDAETVTTSASPTVADLRPYQTRVVSSGAGTAQNYNLGNGAGAVVGQRKLVTFLTRSNASDSIVLDFANIANAAGTQATLASMATAGQFFLFEWNGTKWQVIRTTGTITP